MPRKDKGRNRANGATPNTYDTRDHTEQDTLQGWFGLSKSSRINRKQKRGWQRRQR